MIECYCLYSGDCSPRATYLIATLEAVDFTFALSLIVPLVRTSTKAASSSRLIGWLALRAVKKAIPFEVSLIPTFVDSKLPFDVWYLIAVWPTICEALALG